MNFGFSEEQEMLRESAKRFLDAECPPSFVRKMIESETAHSGDLWRKLASLGWLGVLVHIVFGFGWAAFHVLVITLQAFIFMVLTIIYLSMAHEHH